MKEDAQDSGSRQVPLLLRQVVVPRWLQVILTALWLILIARIAMGGILQAVLIVLVAGAVIVLVFDPLRRRAGQNDSAQMFNEIHCARSSAEADEVFWRAICTYQVWALTLNLIGTVIFVLDLFGVIDAL